MGRTDALKDLARVSQDPCLPRFQRGRGGAREGPGMLGRGHTDVVMDLTHVSQDPSLKGVGEGPWRGRGGAEAGEAGEIGEASEAGEARKTCVSVSCLIIKNTGGEGGEEGNRLLLGAQSYARAQK